MTGITNMIRNVLRGVTPSAINPAQLKDPIIPLDPVPDAYAVKTRLKYL